MLEKQIQVYSVDTGNFYSNNEADLHWLNHELKIERRDLTDKIKNIEKELKLYGLKNDDISSILLDECDIDYSQFSNWENDINKMKDLSDQYKKYKYWLSYKNDKIKYSRNRLLNLMKNKLNENVKSKGKHHIRELKSNKVSDKNIVSIFESNTSRVINAKQDKLSETLIIVQVYYFDIIDDLINFGFTYNGENYIYFTSSAGQIRNKKCVFIKESVWNEKEKTFLCGLTLDIINSKGGCNPNKYLSYLALNNSATDLWEDFDIDKSIVVDDFKTQVYGTYDFIDDKDYSITRMSDYVPVPHTDGAGMILPNAFCKTQKNMMVRLPWIKGLLGVFDFAKFIDINSCSPIIKDIYGKEHDIVAEDIQVIFTASQFKMLKYYDSWDHYKECYKKYGCSAGIAKIEEDRIKNASINYQMLQTLTDITDEEIDKIVEKSNYSISSICDSVENMQKAFGVNPYNTKMTYFQKAIKLYPDLLNDVTIKSLLKDIKDGIVNRCRSGKININGKYTFVLPDFYAACEYWFMDIKNPKGLLNDGEVFCWLFRKSEKLDCLRSPHLYKEHAVRKNIACVNEKKQKDLREWFVTDGVYTSTHDLISKVLQFDDH